MRMLLLLNARAKLSGQWPPASRCLKSELAGVLQTYRADAVGAHARLRNAVNCWLCPTWLFMLKRAWNRKPSCAFSSSISAEPDRYSPCATSVLLSMRSNSGQAYQQIFTVVMVAVKRRNGLPPYEYAGRARLFLMLREAWPLIGNRKRRMGADMRFYQMGSSPLSRARSISRAKRIFSSTLA